MNNDQLKGKITFFESVLFDFFKKAGREHLPWRREGIGAYEVWVSEVMLQQTQVSRVLDYYEKFLRRFPNVETLAEASWEEFLPYYAGLGYYARGRNMLRAAKVVAERFAGKFPREIPILETLPGIGPYTAAAIASFAYGKERIAWDTNVRRVVGRYFLGTKSLALHRSNSKITVEFQNSKTKHKNAGIPDQFDIRFSISAKVLNAALMDFGSATCTGRPKCGVCPLALKCRYVQEGGRGELKPKSKSNIKEGIGIDWKEAMAEVTLHENHKKYFSSIKNVYRPFALPASHNTRAGIKNWFRECYGLLVSVRPPHERVVRDGRATLLVNAQILAGTHSFEVFSRSVLKERLEKN